MDVGEGPFGLVLIPAAAEPGLETEGPLPTKVDSEGLRPQENISALGIFQPLLQPVWLPASMAKTNPV
jgi:hypothetical protein